MVRLFAFDSGTRQQIICSTQTMSEPMQSRLTNLVAAFALAATDDMLAEIEAMSGMIAGAPAALAMMLAYPGISLDTLRKFLRLTPSGAGRLVDRLVAAGLMERRAGSSDLRFIALYLTRRGQSVAERVLAARRAAIQQPLTALTSQEQAELEKLLDKMLYAMTPDRERCDHICRLCEIAACPQDICPVETAALAWEASATQRSTAPAKRKRRT
jgi:MarR family transcriptional regulator, negative regulator of the multidrug operon emrRAB